MPCVQRSETSRPTSTGVSCHPPSLGSAKARADLAGPTSVKRTRGLLSCIGSKNKPKVGTSRAKRMRTRHMHRKQGRAHVLENTAVSLETAAAWKHFHCTRVVQAPQGMFDRYTLAINCCTRPRFLHRRADMRGIAQIICSLLRLS